MTACGILDNSSNGDAHAESRLSFTLDLSCVADRDYPRTDADQPWRFAWLASGVDPPIRSA
jgi:hypothetical protein